MKQILSLLLIGFALLAFARDDADIVAMEDFSRFDPGEYKNGTWKIVEENGHHILQVQKEANVLSGWTYYDRRGVDYILRVRFRLHEEKTVLWFLFHRSVENAQYPYMEYRFQLMPDKTFLGIGKDHRYKEKMPVALPPLLNFTPALKPGAWYEVEFRVRKDSFDSILIYPDGTEKQLIKTKLMPGSRSGNNLYFTGPADVEWIKSYPYPEEQ